MKLTLVRTIVATLSFLMTACPERDVRDPETGPDDPGSGGSCSALSSENPIRIHDCHVEAGYEVYTFTPGGAPAMNVIGIYETHGDHGFMDHPAGVGTVHVSDPGPMVLVLSSYEPVSWTITADDPAAIERILLLGYHRQTASAPDGVPVEEYTYEAGTWSSSGSMCGYSWPYNGGGCETGSMLATAELLAGRKVTAFAGCYDASLMTIGAGDGGDPGDGGGEGGSDENESDDDVGDPSGEEHCN